METAAPAPPIGRRSAGRYVTAALVGVLAALLVAAGVAGLWARYGAAERGYITTGSHQYAAGGRALVTGALDADGIPSGLLANARATVSSPRHRPLFVGVGRRADVDRYLAGVARSTVEDVNFGPFDVTYSATAGRAVPARPAAQTFWAQARVGGAEQTVSWPIRGGDWRVVVMNADASPGVVADAKAGVTIRGALPVAISLLAVGLALAGAAAAVALRRPRL